MLNISSADEILGLRPGEALRCKNSFDGNGCPCCGTTAFCSQCGAVKAILSAQTGKNDTQECRIITKSGDALDFLITTKKIDINGSDVTMFSARNIAGEKRRIILEKLFYHDVTNLAGVLYSLSEMLRDNELDQNSLEYYDILFGTSKALIEELQSFKMLSQAESKELVAKFESVSSFSLIKEVISIYSKHRSAFSKNITVTDTSEDINMETDRTIIRRVLGNMMKNALEASIEGETVTIDCRRDGDHVIFSVHNRGFIHHDVKLQIFQRSFSTKGDGRGIGTYSIKLLTENYLKGKADFISSPEEGTTFFITVPVTFPDNPF
jgi:signal transduction histidine kinase